MIKSLKDISEQVLSSLSSVIVPSGIDVEHSKKLRSIFEDTIQNYSHLFEDKVFTRVSDEHSVIEYILPTIKRAYSKFYIKVPGVFELQNNSKMDTKYQKRRLELFQLQFDLKDFLTFLSLKFKSNCDILEDFKNLDKESEILTLIVEDYIVSKIRFVSSVNFSDIEREIRSIKLERHLEIDDSN
jgi:hypothetical protein